VSLRVLVVQHEDDDPIHLMGSWMEGVDLATCRPYAGDAVPTSVDGCDGLVVMGGEHGSDRLHALDAHNHGFADLAQRLGLGAAVRRDFQHKADMAVLDHQALDHVLLDHGASARRIDHLVQRLQNVFAGDAHVVLQQGERKCPSRLLMSSTARSI